MEITLRQLLSVIRKNIVTILVCTLLFSAGAFALSRYVIPKTYVSTVKLFVSTPNSANNSTTDINALNYAQKVVNTYIEMLQTNSFYQNVMEKTQLSLEPDQIKKMIQFSTLNDTEVFQASVSSGDPGTAKKIADAITELAPTTISSFKEEASLKVVDPAKYPDMPSSPNTVLNTVVGFLLGSILSTVFLLLKDMLDVRIKGEEDITQNYNIPVLASIPAFSKEFTKQKAKRT